MVLLGQARLRRFWQPADGWLVSLILLAIALRLIGIDYGLPLHLPSDESSQVETALGMLGGDLNPHFFRYSSLFINQLFVIDSAAQLYANLSRSPLKLPNYYILGRLLTAVYGASTVWAVFLLGKVLFDPRVGLAAGLFLAVAPQHVLESHFAAVDVAMVFWVVLAFVLALQAYRSGRSFLPSAAAAGLAIGTKYAAVLIIPLLFALLLWHIWRRRATYPLELIRRGTVFLLMIASLVALGALMLFPVSSFLDWARQWTSDGNLKSEYLNLFQTFLLAGRSLCVIAAAIGLLGLQSVRVRRLIALVLDTRVVLFAVVVAGTFVVSSPFVVLDLPSAARDILYEYRHMLIGSAAQYAVAEPVFNQLMPNSFFPQPSYYWDWWLGQNGWIVTIITLAGVVILARRRPSAFAVTITLVIVLWFTLTHAANKAERYALIALPLLLLWTGIGVDSSIKAIVPAPGLGQVMIVGVMLSVPLWATANLLYQEFILTDTRIEALQWIRENVPPSAVVVREGYTPDLEHADLPITVLVVTGAFENSTFEDWQNGGTQYILVGSLRAWYRDRASLYPRTVQNYEILERRGQLVAEFHAQQGRVTGPSIWVYKLP